MIGLLWLEEEGYSLSGQLQQRVQEGNLGRWRKETMELEKREEDRAHVGRKVSEGCVGQKGKTIQCTNRCQNSLFLGKSQMRKKVLLPQTILKSTPHPETSCKNKSTKHLL